MKRAPEPSGKGICLGDLAAHNALSQARSREGPGGPVPTSAPGPPEGPSGSSDQDNSSDELNSKFRSQCLHSSSSSSSSSSAYETARGGPSSPESSLGATPKSPLLSRSPSTNNPFPNPAAHRSGAGTTLPKVRTPLTPRDGVQLVKKHDGQPQPGPEPSSACSTLKSAGTAAGASSQFPQVVEETDIDDGLPNGTEGLAEGPGSEEPRRNGVSLVGPAEQLGPPPTPPLHRFPSWVRRQILYLHI